MTPRWLLALGTVMSLGSLAGADNRLAPPPSPSTWLWTASDAKPWRLPAAGSQVLIVDRSTALVRTSAGELVRLSLDTGIAEPAVPVVQDFAHLEVLVRAGSRIFGFGTDPNGSAAWEITLSPLAARPIAVEDSEVLDPRHGFWEAVASADGTRIVVCAPDRHPIVRDVRRRLARIEVLRDVPCDDPRFIDNEHVAFDGSALTIEVGIADGTRVEKPSTDPIVLRGPAGRTLTKHDKHFTLRDRKGAILADGESYSYVPIKWTPDGRAVWPQYGEIAIYPPPTGRIDLPEYSGTFDVDDRRAVFVSDYQVLVIDLATGALERPEGNSGTLRAIAVGGGSAFVVSDRLRAFKAGAQTIAGEQGIYDILVGTALGPVVTTGLHATTTWDPATGDRRVLHEMAGLGDQLFRGKNEIAYNDGAKLYRRKASGSERHWVTAANDATLATVDLANDVAVWKYKDAIRVVEPARDRITSFAVADPILGCGLLEEVRAMPGRRLAIDTLTALHVYDQAGGWQATASFTEAILAWSVAGQEIALATTKDLVLWNPAAGTAIAMPLGREADPRKLATSGDGKEIAVVLADGAVLYTTVAHVRAHGTPRTLEPVTLPTCTATTVPFEELVLDRGE